MTLVDSADAMAEAARGRARSGSALYTAMVTVRAALLRHRRRAHRRGRPPLLGPSARRHHSRRSVTGAVSSRRSRRCRDCSWRSREACNRPSAILPLLQKVSLLPMQVAVKLFGSQSAPAKQPNFVPLLDCRSSRGSLARSRSAPPWPSRQSTSVLPSQRTACPGSTAVQARPCRGSARRGCPTGCRSRPAGRSPRAARCRRCSSRRSRRCRCRWRRRRSTRCRRRRCRSRSRCCRCW